MWCSSHTAAHGGRIELVAVTDGGDAALSSDSFAEIRLWPTLDGTHEPVVVHGPQPTQLALGRDREGLFAAILDEAGDVELLRFDGDGGVLGRAQLAGQPAVAQVVAIPGGVLVRRADHSIERFDARGVATGRLVPAAGQRVVSLAVRRDRALAGIAEDDESRAQRVRWIVLDRSLRWGASVALPEPLANLAIAPGGHRISGVAHDKLGNAEVGRILELAPQPRVVGRWCDDVVRRQDRRAARDPVRLGLRALRSRCLRVGEHAERVRGAVTGAPGSARSLVVRAGARWGQGCPAVKNYNTPSRAET